jgi:hypothetical protein
MRVRVHKRAQRAQKAQRRHNRSKVDTFLKPPCAFCAFCASVVQRVVVDCDKRLVDRADASEQVVDHAVETRTALRSSTCFWKRRFVPNLNVCALCTIDRLSTNCQVVIVRRLLNWFLDIERD